MSIEHDYFGLIGDYWAERKEYGDQDVEIVLDADPTSSRRRRSMPRRRWSANSSSSTTSCETSSWVSSTAAARSRASYRRARW